MDGRSTQILVADVGGSHMAASVFDTASSNIDSVCGVPVVREEDSAGFFRTFQSLLDITLPASASLRGIAIAIPGPFDYESGISYMQHKFKSLYQMDLRRELSERTFCPPEKICFINDASASLLGEMQHGGAAGAKRAIGITLGTGVGSAFAVDGKIVVEGRGVPPAGEVWNQGYRDGIVEDFISTRAIQRTFKQLTGKHSDVRSIASLAMRDRNARETFAQFGTELGKFLRSICIEFAPDRIVLGGAIARAAEYFLPPAVAELADVPIELRVSKLFERAPLIGAGVNWVNRNGGSFRERDRPNTTRQV